MDDNEKKARQKIANQKYRDSKINFYKEQYDRIKNDPVKMQQNKINNQAYYIRNKAKILLKMKNYYYEKRKKYLEEL